MKYLKLFESEQFKKGDYVKIIGEDDNELYKIYSINLSNKFYILTDKNGKFVWHNAFGKGMTDEDDDLLEWTMWFRKSDIRLATEIELDSIKYNL